MNKLAFSGKPAVLVPQSDSLGAIAVIRSLGQHGYQVHAASTKPDALGGKSSFAAFTHTSPSYQSDDYLPWLRQLISQQQIQAIVPSEGFLLAIRTHFTEFSHLMDIPQDQEIVYGCFSKVDVFERFQQNDDMRLRMHLPKTGIVCSIEELSNLDTTGWELPFFIKGDASYNSQGDDALVSKITTIEDFRIKASEILSRFKKILVQDFYPGEKVTVNLLLKNGQPLAESMAIGVHQNPHTGGVMSLRRSWWHREIYEDALRRLKALHWNGAAMVEYKWDSQRQQFAFIELNSRYWGALNLDILAGLHFPAIQMDYFLNKKMPLTTTRLTKSITVRQTFPADFGYLLSKLRDPSVKPSAKLKSFCGFFIYFLHPRIYTDLNYPGDRRLVFFNAKAFLSELIRSLVKKL